MLQITLSKTLRAVVVLRGCQLEHVVVRGYDEPTHLENGKLDMWSKSRYDVFKKVRAFSHPRQHWLFPMIILPFVCMCSSIYHCPYIKAMRACRRSEP